MNDYVVEGLMFLALCCGYEVIVHNGKVEVPELEKALCFAEQKGQ